MEHLGDTLLILLPLLFGQLRDAVVSELSDIGGAMQDLNQTYTYNGIAGHSGRTHGSSWSDARDWCDTPEDARNAGENCISFSILPTNEI